jgi:hypothetical protein
MIPTPTAQDCEQSRSAGYSGPNHHTGTTLTDFARMWPTPQARDYRIGYRPGSGAPGRVGSAPLNDVVRLWPTPTARDGASGPGHAETAQGSPNLRTAVTSWPTPTARLGTRRGPQAKRYYERRHGSELDDAVAASGVSGSLNPLWVEWLMGFPTGWTDCEP